MTYRYKRFVAVTLISDRDIISYHSCNAIQPAIYGRYCTVCIIFCCSDK